MSTPRVTRSLTKQSLRPSSLASSESPTINGSAKASESAKAATGGVKREAAKGDNTTAKSTARGKEEVSQTPPKKRQRKTGNAKRPSPPHEGPQHHDGPKLDLLAQQRVLEDSPAETHPPNARPAEPHQTNALLQTPHGSRVAAYTEDMPAEQSSPSKKPSKASKKKSEAGGASHSLPKPTTDTNQLLADGVAHLIKVDPRIKPVIDAHHCHVFSPEGLAELVDPFRALSSGILAQQVSGAAAAAIKKRFVALFVPEGEATDKLVSDNGRAGVKDAFPTPEQVAAADIALLRSAGLSQRKAEYVKGLAEKFSSGELSARMLAEASYDEVLEKLIAVRGLGRWSVEMFACFGLKRMDVFSTGDLGVQRGMAAFAGRDVAKLKNKGGKWKYMSEQDMIDMAEKFAPYRSLFMWYMWRVEDVNVDAIQNN